jgi:hypothetical protein
VYLSLFFILACTLAQSKQETKSIQMQNLWKKNAVKEDFFRAFGKYSETDGKSIAYRFPPPRRDIESAHFFNPKGVIEEQFIFVSKNDLQKLLKYIPCQWEKKSALKSFGHSVGNVESGLCISYGISYEFQHSMHLYEVRWKR